MTGVATVVTEATERLAAPDVVTSLFSVAEMILGERRTDWPKGVAHAKKRSIVLRLGGGVTSDTITSDAAESAIMAVTGIT